MQGALVQRYLGNKNSIADHIVQAMSEFSGPGDTVLDAFSGSLATSAAFRAADYEVACNDINHFSWLFARAYFSTTTMPWPVGFARKSKESREQMWARVVAGLTAPYQDDIPKLARRTDIFDHYCEEGQNSFFTSRRGKSGKRRFFSAENAELIDRALCRIRYWYASEKIDELTMCILKASLISAVEKVSNTQGTYHDFPRDFIDARSLKTIDLRPPLRNWFGGRPSKYIGKAEDSLTFVKSIPKHRVLYLDPPYNFRQYTSYYFMLNLLSEYAERVDLDTYFENIEFVRGQNMETDFKSSFCSKSGFLPSLRELISNANSDYVVLSYFDGKNHWGKFKSTGSELTGKRILQQLFASDLFVSDSAKCIPISRTNYQSYGGHTAQTVNELLFIAQKVNPPTVQKQLESDVGSSNWIGSAVA